MTAPRAPVLDVDPFDDAFLANPYPFHERIREAGAVVFLDRYQNLRLRAPRRGHDRDLRTGRPSPPPPGVGLDDFRRSKPWRPPSLILEADPPLHTRTPHGAQPRALRQGDGAACGQSFTDAAEKTRRRAARRRRVDAIADIAEAYPLSRVSRRVGLKPEGLENLLPYGTMVFNAFGPRNRHFEASMARRQRSRRLDQRAMRTRGAVARRARRDHLGGSRQRRNHRRGSAAAGALAAARPGSTRRSSASATASSRSPPIPTNGASSARESVAACARPSTKCCAGNRRCRPSSARRPSGSNSAAWNLPAGREDPAVPRRRQSRPPPLAGAGAVST